MPESFQGIDDKPSPPAKPPGNLTAAMRAKKASKKRFSDEWHQLRSRATGLTKVMLDELAAQNGQR
jgi:hypothetical protein